MAAVTQITSNFLGGVSRQPDDKKQENQLVDILNGYSDPTYGLVKRGGTRFLWNLTSDAEGTFFGANQLSNAFFFYASTTTIVTAANKNDYPGREVGDRILHPYICCIHEDNVHMWDSLDGDYVSVTNNGQAYLRRGTTPESYYDADDYHYRAILDNVIITNKQKVTAMTNDGGTFNAKRVGTVRVNNVVANTDYTVIIDGTSYTHNSGATPSTDNIISGLNSAITAGGITKTNLKTSLELSKGSAFTLEVRDGGTNQYMNSYQDNVNTIEELANPSSNNRLVNVIGLPNDTKDDYYLKYNTTSDTWEETRDPTANSGINSATMPHRLFINNSGNWEFGPIPWKDRLVGSEETSPDPSFIGNPIKASFYYNNRLGLLSESNVIMSRAKGVYNFFPESQLTTLDSDPIDLDCNSTRPVELVDVVPQPAGLVLFAGREQFYLSAPETGVLTPTSTIIKGISNYECDYNISPLEVGTSIGFVSKMPDYTRLMLMEAQGLQAEPTVVEISKVITGWMPGNITMMAASPQNSFVILASRNTKNMYIYRFYNDGQEDRMQAWQRWRLPGNIQACNIVNDLMFLVTYQGSRYTTSVISINELTNTTVRVAGDGITASSPALDMLSTPFRADNTNQVTYDAVTKRSKIYVGFPVVESLTPVAILTIPSDRGGAAPVPPQSNAASLTELVVPFETSDEITLSDIDPEDIIDDSNNTPSEVTKYSPGFYREGLMGNDANGNFIEVDGDWTEYYTATQKNIACGYKFDYEVTLPKLYFRLAAKNMAPDYTASLTIQRVKFSIGRTGAVNFKLRAFGRETWDTINPVLEADFYEADAPPLLKEVIFTLPINQRNKHFQLKVTSDMPFPVSLISMMWEGNYSPRFYRRV